MRRRDLLKFTGAAVSLAVLPKTLLANSLSPTVATPATLAGYGFGIPTLPQSDAPLGQFARQAGLAAQRLSYVWTEQYPNLTGIPMGAQVPLAELPTIEWLLQAAVQIAELLINLFASLLAQLPSNASTILDHCVEQLATLKDRLQQQQERHDALLAQALGGHASAQVQQDTATLRQSMIACASQLIGLKDTAFLEIGRLQAEKVSFGRFDEPGLARYDAMFVTLPRPEIAGYFRQNDSFAYLRVGGPNPMLIQGVTSLPAKFPLTDEQFRQVMGSGDNLFDATAEGRLYLLDYVELSTTTSPTVIEKFGNSHYDQAPIALFALPRGGSALRPVAIQCSQDPQRSGMILAPASDDPTGDYWLWQMAKTAVQTADVNYHEMYVHLARTHLVSEAFCLATQRQLASSHPLHTLLTPHFEGAMFINELAALIIMGKDTFADQILAAPIEQSRQSAGNARLSFDFYARMLPNDLRARRVDDPAKLPLYPYRDDALLIWQAIADWVGDYVSIYYRNDQDVINDGELGAWVDELIRLGKVSGFRPILNRGQLAEVLTMVIFTASAQHAAVNFPQRDDMTYIPAYAGDQGAPAPVAASTSYAESDWFKLMPQALLTDFAQLYFLAILGSVHYRPLGDYRSNQLPYAPIFSDPRVTASSGPLARFQARLRDIETLIEQRNAQRPQRYDYLRPSLIPTSTNI